MGLRYSQGKYGEFTYGLSPAGFSYRVELADPSGNLKAYANNEIVSLEWQYSDAGGCDKFKLTLKRDYDDLSNVSDADLKSLYDIKVYIVPDFGESAVLFYRGFITNIRPVLQDANEVVIISGKGYGYLLKKKQIYINNGAPKEYTSTDFDTVLDDITTNYMPSGISVGTLDSFNVNISSMKFNGSVWEAIEKLADIVGAEWGVDSSKTFFFHERSNTRGKRFRIGYDVQILEDEIDYDGIVNKVIVEGGDVDGVPVRVIVENAGAAEDYGVTFEERIRNSAVLDVGVATALANSYLEKYKDYNRNTRIIVPRYNEKIEADQPMKKVVLDSDPRPNVWKYGAFKYGEQKYSADTEYIIRNIRYQLNDTSLAVELEFNQGKPDLARRLDRMLFQLEQQRQSAGV